MKYPEILVKAVMISAHGKLYLLEWWIQKYVTHFYYDSDDDNIDYSAFMLWTFINPCSSLVCKPAEKKQYRARDRLIPLWTRDQNAPSSCSYHSLWTQWLWIKIRSIVFPKQICVIRASRFRSSHCCTDDQKWYWLFLRRTDGLNSRFRTPLRYFRFSDAIVHYRIDDRQTSRLCSSSTKIWCQKMKVRDRITNRSRR